MKVELKFKLLDEIILVFMPYKSVVFGIILIVYSVGFALQSQFGGNTIGRFGSLVVVLALGVVLLNHYILDLREIIDKTESLYDNFQDQQIHDLIVDLRRKGLKHKNPKAFLKSAIEKMAGDAKIAIEKIRLIRRNFILLEFSLGASGTLVWGYADLFDFYR